MSAEGIPSEWYFITPPQSVSWAKEGEATEISTYGSNSPYLQYATTSLRKLTLSDALIEGFSDAKAVEDNVRALENCMRMMIDEGTGYASPFCWTAYAAGKSYGTYLITSVNVTEKMRDMGGKATRAKVDIEMIEVPSYQVSTGTDITAQVIQGKADKKYAEQIKALEASGKQDKKVAGSRDKNKGAGAGAGTTPGTNPGAPTSGNKPPNQPIGVDAETRLPN